MAAITAEWRRRLGTDLELVKSLLVPDSELASTFPRPGNQGDPYQVVAHGPEDFVGVGEDDERVPLSRADLIIYRLSPNVLTRTVAGAFGTTFDGTSVEGLASTFRVGSYRPTPTTTFPVYLTIQLEWRDYLSVVEALAARATGPFLLMAPTNRHHRGLAEERLETCEAAFLPLADAIRIGEGGAWELTDAARTWLAGFCARVTPTSDSGPAYFPTPRGARWSDVRITFLDGHRVTVKVGAVKRTLNYTQMGFVDGRDAEPDKQWELLQAFGKSHGVLTWNSPSAAPQNQKRKELLVQLLRTFFRLEGDPIVATADGKGWQTGFAISGG